MMKTMITSVLIEQSVRQVTLMTISIIILTMMMLARMMREILCDNINIMNDNDNDSNNNKYTNDFIQSITEIRSRSVGVRVTDDRSGHYMR